MGAFLDAAVTQWYCPHLLAFFFLQPVSLPDDKFMCNFVSLALR